MKNEQSSVATYGEIYNVYIIQIRIYVLFCFTDKVCWSKTEQSDVAIYGRRIYVDKKYYGDGCLANVSFIHI